MRRNTRSRGYLAFYCLFTLLSFGALDATAQVVSIIAEKAEDWQYQQKYITFIGSGEEDDPFKIGELSSGAQEIRLDFELEMHLPRELPSARTLVGWIALGQNAEIFAGKKGNDAFLGIRLDPLQSGVTFFNQPLQNKERADLQYKYSGVNGGGVAAVSIIISAPDSFRTEGRGELCYSYSMQVDFNRDTIPDAIVKGTFMDSRWGVNLSLGIERWWLGAAEKVPGNPLKLSLKVK